MPFWKLIGCLLIFSVSKVDVSMTQMNRTFVYMFVSMGVRGKPPMYLSLAGLLYHPLWTFQLWPPDASAPTDASRTLAAEVGTYGRGMRTGNLA
jgi:hypothetical protein